MSKDNIKFIGHLTDTELADYYKRCKAFVFPQEEDFGIVALEAQAAGAPVIAYKAGGALDTVIEGKTGVFFNKQNKESLTKAIKKFKKLSFNQKDLIKNAERFSKQKFKREILRATKHG
jgi:glycosyltransferase involved in cell wall biosynthesis